MSDFIVCPQPKAWAPFDFYRKFTPDERKAVRALAKTDPDAEDFLHTLDGAIASNTLVRADDPETILGMAYLSVVPPGNPVLAAGRADEILEVTGP